jgi:hypothetical protein
VGQSPLLPIYFPSISILTANSYTNLDLRLLVTATSSLHSPSILSQTNDPCLPTNHRGGTRVWEFRRPLPPTISLPYNRLHRGNNIPHHSPSDYYSGTLLASIPTRWKGMYSLRSEGPCICGMVRGKGRKNNNACMTSCPFKAMRGRMCR